jgi:HEPN domain-containing protein
LPKKTDTGKTSDWLDFITADLETADLLMAHRKAFTVCRSKLAEALEKAIKANLIQCGWRLEKILDLQKLCDLLSGYHPERVITLQGLVNELAESYTVDRYPGFDLDDSDWDSREKLRLMVHEYVNIVTNEIKA